MAEALATVQQRRRMAQPNPGFWKQLLAHEEAGGIDVIRAALEQHAGTEPEPEPEPEPAS